MKITCLLIVILLLTTSAFTQTISIDSVARAKLIQSDSLKGRPKIEWYSESINNGIIIQNSFPKGGLYPGTAEFYHLNPSYLVFFTRVFNGTTSPLELAIDFSADSITIPGSPGIVMKLLLPADTMTFEKRSLFSYGIRQLDSFNKPTQLRRTINPNDECFFLVVGFFYKTSQSASDLSRGGNRAEFILKGKKLFYNMPPQVQLLPCGHIISKK